MTSALVTEKKREYSLSKVLLNQIHIQRTMVHHKSVRRACRRCAAMVKIAAFMMMLIFISAFLHVNFEEVEMRESVRDYLAEEPDILSRHQRQVKFKRMGSERRLTSSIRDVTMEHQTSMSPNPPALLEKISNSQKTKLTEPKQQKFKGVELELANQIRPKPIGYEPTFMTVEYDVLLTKEFKEKEREIQMKWSEKIKQKKFQQNPPNPAFIFHNKLPKSGSSTMNNILKKLSHDNNFNFLKMETSDFQTSDDQYLIKELKEKIKEPFLLLKHHRWLDFTKSGQPQPTYINVMRDPLEWFTSRYYFSRYGWERKPGCRKADCGMSEEDHKMEIDECVQKRHRECLSPWMYVQFFCGTAPECYNSTTLEQKEKAMEIAKQNILDEYYAVGILEQFEDSLKLFEIMLPDYFRNAVPIWKSEFVQAKQRLTRTTYKKEMSEESKNFFRNGPLHYEIELYNFARELFNERLKRFHIQSTVKS